MVILFANKFFFPKGGAETVFFQDRQFCINRGYRVIDFSMHHPNNADSRYSRYFVPNVDYHSQPRSPKGYLEQINTSIDFVYHRKAVQNLKRLIQTQKPQIAHIHNIYHQITPEILPCLKAAGIKILLTLHDYKILCPIYTMYHEGQPCQKCSGGAFWQSVRHRCREKSIGQSMLLCLEAYWHKWRNNYECVDLFICPSRFMEKMMAARFGRKKIVGLENGVDTHQISYSNQDRGYALYFGRLSNEKGLETLLKAHERLFEKKPVVLLVVGDGPLKDELQDQYPAARFLGFQTGPKLRKIIENCGFVIVPSEWYENCSMSVLEAMAFGKPVIAAAIGGLPEQIIHKKNGLLFPPRNIAALSERMETLWENRSYRKQLGIQARWTVEKKYSLHMRNRKLQTIYDRLLYT